MIICSWTIVILYERLTNWKENLHMFFIYKIQCWILIFKFDQYIRFKLNFHHFKDAVDCHLNLYLYIIWRAMRKTYYKVNFFCTIKFPQICKINLFDSSNKFNNFYWITLCFHKYRNDWKVKVLFFISSLNWKLIQQLRHLIIEITLPIKSTFFCFNYFKSVN